MSTDFIFLIGPRACGKSTVAATISRLLPGWRAVDLDREYNLRKAKSSRIRLMENPETYYEGSKQILMEHLQGKRLILALGGGTMINPKSPNGDFDVIVSCHTRGPVILLLPSRIPLIAKWILFRREQQREYDLPEKMLSQLRKATNRGFDQRIDFYHQNADFTLYGRNPERLARSIIKKCQLKAYTRP
jgi:shikimate kinase